jgi:hypothetical protein
MRGFTNGTWPVCRSGCRSAPCPARARLSSLPLGRAAQCDREGAPHSYQSTVRREGYCRFHDHFVVGLFREPLRLEL